MTLIIEQSLSPCIGRPKTGYTIGTLTISGFKVRMLLNLFSDASCLNEAFGHRAIEAPVFSKKGVAQ